MGVDTSTLVYQVPLVENLAHGLGYHFREFRPWNDVARDAEEDFGTTILPLNQLKELSLGLREVFWKEWKEKY